MQCRVGECHKAVQTPFYRVQMGELGSEIQGALIHALDK